jgi:hypothetical protein
MRGRGVAGTAGPALVAIAAVVLAGCGGSSRAVTLAGNPSGYLIAPAQLGSPDFTVYEAAAPVGAGWLDQASAAALTRDGWLRAAEVEYYRAVAFATSNGPITLSVTVASFTGAGGAAAALTRLQAALDARPGAEPVSSGTLRGGHAIAIEGSDVDGVPAVEFVMVWRVDNLIDSFVAEGRYGGLQLSQLLPMATTESADEVRG